mmetsp:Transcript_11555/g.16173  ORF Transcript_11555/g.16173 Transcript_11555/m.16173 type:complete len:201 (-) Transcript_11555:165-767(-)
MESTAPSISIPSGNTPTKNVKADGDSSSKKNDEIQLLHPILLSIPLQIRFGIQGVLSNVLFMVLYNTAIEKFAHMYPASSIYAIVYFFYIPIGHALSSLLVFGWPAAYVQNLLSNYPIGLSSIVIGSACTAYLDKIKFNATAEQFVETYIMAKPATEIDEDDSGEFYSSLVVVVITGIYAYLGSVYVNSQPKATDEKKEL